MNGRFLVGIAVFWSIAGSMEAQTYSRRATAAGNIGADRGKCTIEVVVDGAAEVAVRGDTATLRNLAGQPPQWRRFECNGPLPANPADFRFAGVDGRGRQQLVQDPRNGGVAVVRIEDPQSGSEGYTFDLFWSNASSGGNRNFGNPAGPPSQPLGRDPDAYYRDRDARNEEHYRSDEDAYHRDRDGWYREQDWRGRLFQKVREDLDHVQSVTFPGGGDQFRFASTRHELDELQSKLAAGRYDERELDDVIGALQRVVQDNRMTSRDRDLLADDLNRLLDFRARHDSYGVR